MLQTLADQISETLLQAVIEPRGKEDDPALRWNALSEFKQHVDDVLATTFTGVGAILRHTWSWRGGEFTPTDLEAAAQAVSDIDCDLLAITITTRGPHPEYWSALIDRFTQVAMALHPCPADRKNQRLVAFAGKRWLEGRKDLVACSDGALRAIVYVRQSQALCSGDSVRTVLRDGLTAHYNLESYHGLEHCLIMISVVNAIRLISSSPDAIYCPLFAVRAMNTVGLMPVHVYVRMFTANFMRVSGSCGCLKYIGANQIASGFTTTPWAKYYPYAFQDGEVGDFLIDGYEADGPCAYSRTGAVFVDKKRGVEGSADLIREWDYRDLPSLHGLTPGTLVFVTMVFGRDVGQAIVCDLSLRIVIADENHDLEGQKQAAQIEAVREWINRHPIAPLAVQTELVSRHYVRASSQTPTQSPITKKRASQTG